MHHARTTLAALAALAALTSAALPSSASAQGACDSQALDPLGEARRARSILDARERFERRHLLEQRQVRQGTVLDDPEDPPFFQTYGEWIGDVSEISGYTICNGGVPEPAGLAGGWNGFAVGTRMYGGADLSLRLFFLSGGDSLSPDSFTPTDGAIVSADAQGRGHDIWGVTLGWSDWVRLTVGSTQDAITRFDVTGSGDSITTGSSSVSLTGTDRLYLGFGVPELFANFDLIYDADADTPVTYTFLGLDDFPLFFLDPNFSVTAGAGYAAFEDQTISELGFSYGFFDNALRPGVEVAFEFNDPRLRSMRARLDAQLFGNLEIPKGLLVDEDDPSGTDLADFLPSITGGVGVRAEASIFNSRYVFDRTGLSLLRGYSVSGWGQLTVRPFTFGVEVYSAVNHADTLTRLADAANRSQLGTRLHIRLGW